MVSLPRSLRIGTLVPCLLLAAGTAHASASSRVAAVAVFPVENLTGGTIPADDIRKFLIDELLSHGVRVLRDDLVDEFMRKHRVRYAAGIDTETAASLREDTGVDAVVFASVELSSDAVPPKVALFARLVSIGASPVVLWSDAVGLSGDDAPGYFDLGLVNDYRTLQARALTRVSKSLVDYLRTGAIPAKMKTASKFRPRSQYRAVTLEPGRPSSIAVVPFFNLSGRRNAGEILAWLYLRHLSSFQEFRVADPGVARRQLLDARIIMEGGLSITDAETVAALIDADFILGGRVLRYDDYEGAGVRPRVEFSTVLIEKKTRRVVWSSDSCNDGDDGVRFFGRGASRTAHTMATQMVRRTTELIVGRKQ